MTQPPDSILIGPSTLPALGHRTLPHHEPGTLWDELHLVVGAYPDHVALRDAHTSMTFRELDGTTGRAAAALVALGVQRGALVGLVTKNDARTFAMTLAIVRAGAVCVPLDPRDPRDRTRDAVTRLTLDLVVTQGSAALDLELDTRTVPIDDLDRSSTERAAQRPRGGSDDVALLYLTSGSTGRAKAVPHTNARLVRMLWAQRYLVGHPPGSHDAMLYPLSFLGSLVIGGGSLLSGATACIYDLATQGVEPLADWLVQERINYLSAVPSVLSVLTATMVQHGTVNPSIDYLAYGGEGFARREVDALRSVFPNACVTNAYGSQEAGTVTMFEMPPGRALDDGPIPAGTPFPWYGLAVVDPDGAPVPLGEDGHVVFFGDAVIDRYWQDPALDAEQFVRMPDGTRALRSGDLGRVRAGRLEVLGRLDGRVKVRGNGVDTIEVEHALSALDGVVAAAVTPVTLPDGTTRLVAHVQLVPIDQPTVGALRRELGRAVPAFAVPSRFVIVHEVPHTPRGKVDRAALREDGMRVLPRAAPVPPDGPLEAELVARFEEILALDDVGATDDFFELGGDSLDAVELILAIEALTEVRLAPSQLLAAATPRELARALDDGPGRATTVVRLVTGDPARVPLVCVAGGGAHALFLRPLATRLAERTVYGVHARGIESREAFDRTVEARVRGHLADLRAVHPTGPYVIAGHSFGGLVAYEMAQQLRAEGVDVPLLVLLDTDLPDPSGSRLDDVVPRFQELYPGDGLGPRTRRGVRLAYVSLRRRSAAAIGRFRELSDPRRREAFAHLNAGLGLTYEPTPAPGPVLLLRAESDDEPQRLERAPDLGWGALVTSGLRVEPVPAHHVTMVREPEVAGVARLLAQALDDLDRARRT